MIRAAFVAGRRVTSRQSQRRLYATETPLVNVTKPSDSGQPLFKTHPHLVKPNELTEGIPAEEYDRRRRQLMESLPESSMVVCLAGSIKYMSGNIFYKFRQASDFWYLTGFQEPDAAVILEKDSCTRGYRMTLFCRSKDIEWEKWNGSRNGVETAAEIFHADEASDITRFPSHLKQLISHYSNIYVEGSPPKRRKSILNYLATAAPLSRSKAEYDNIIDSLSGSRRRELAPEVFRIRLIKSEVEQAVMRTAADISSHAHTKTMRFARSGRSEADLAAHFEYTCAVLGAQRLAYVPVVASGANALTIHYTANNHIINNGELVLIDAGCEYNGYASDITRTWPVSGRFTEPQRLLYQAVLNVEKACIALCAENNRVTLMDLHRRSCRFLTDELKSIGFDLRGSDVERILYPHFLSHSLGIDLHETQNNRSDLLKSGMVITIEPGIYVPPDPQFPREFHNLGIRIEDEVLIQQNHAVVLSIDAPKEVVDVEGACQGLLELQNSEQQCIERGLTY